MRVGPGIASCDREYTRVFGQPCSPLGSPNSLSRGFGAKTEEAAYLPPTTETDAMRVCPLPEQRYPFGKASPIAQGGGIFMVTDPASIRTANAVRRVQTQNEDESQL